MASFNSSIEEARVSTRAQLYSFISLNRESKNLALPPVKKWAMLLFEVDLNVG